MKKAISLSTGILLSVIVFAQDSLSGKNIPSNNNRDTAVNNNPAKNKWPQDSVNKKAWPNTDSTLQHSTTLKEDSMTTTAQPAAAQKSKQDTTVNSSAGSTAKKESDSTAMVTDRIMMKNDSVFLFKNNEPAVLDKNYKLESGAVVSKSGTVTYPGGRSVQLKNGQFIELKPLAENTESKKASSSVSKKKHVASKKKIATRP